LSISPDPEKVMLDPIPNGFPVLSFGKEVYDMSTPPVTDNSPALAADIAARDPQSADAPIFVNLFIILLLLDLFI
jgi:hypothetical protein